MDVENIDVVGPELLQGCIHGIVHRLHAVPDERGLLFDVVLPALVVGGVLRLHQHSQRTATIRQGV